MPEGTIESQRLEALDEEVEELKRTLDDAAASFGDALDEVSRRPDVDVSAQKRLVEVGNRLKALQPKIRDLNFDLEQSTAMLSSILEVDRAVHSTDDDLDRFEQILLGVERVRQVIRDALDEYVGGERPDRRELVARLRELLPDVMQPELAELVAVDPRTLRRWSSEPGEPSHRLLLVTRIIRVLRHAWTPSGVLAWFKRPRRGLGGECPIDVIDDPAYERDLLAEARGSRNQYAT